MVRRVPFGACGRRRRPFLASPAGGASPVPGATSVFVGFVRFWCVVRVRCVVRPWRGSVSRPLLVCRPFSVGRPSAFGASFGFWRCVLGWRVVRSWCVARFWRAGRVVCGRPCETVSARVRVGGVRARLYRRLTGMLRLIGYLRVTSFFGSRDFAFKGVVSGVPAQCLLQ